uniref:RING-type E3 ubiquitin transferase n=1 Tax=Cicer arietinum TaxID=3827 RepID=A0A3Q7YA64_CICAR|nr:putative RING-H2 finger protein ATL21B [Cicer arietinum]
MITCYNISAVMILIIVVCNTVIWGVNGCIGRDLRCGRHGPPIRFPFRLKDTEYGCGYPGFDLTCSHTNKTLLKIPTHPHPVILQVTSIDYKLQLLHVSDPENCLSKQFLKLLQSPISITPFQFESSDHNDSFTFLHCSSLFCPVYIEYSDNRLLDQSFDLIHCTKILDISSSVFLREGENDLVLKWSKPNCRKCEIKGKMCKLNNNGTEDEIECFDRHHKSTKKILLLAAD